MKLNKKEPMFLSKQDFRDRCMEIEQKILDHPGSITGAAFDEKNTLKHTFCDGQYIREIFMPKGQLFTTGIHKQEHPYFVQKGKVKVLTENGMQHIQAPYNGITKPGTKRVIYTEEDTIWITVHATKKKTVKTVLKQIIAKNFDDPKISIETMKKNLQIKNK